MSAPVERKYALQRVKAGDYLLLSNDGRTLWRIARYTEDGSATTQDGRELRGEFWGTWLYERPAEKFAGVTNDGSDWDGFTMDSCLLRTRAKAIAAVLGRRP